MITSVYEGQEQERIQTADAIPGTKLIIAFFSFNCYVNTNKEMHFKNFINNILSMDVQISSSADIKISTWSEKTLQVSSFREITCIIYF